MGTLRGFPFPPALWLRPAKPAFANAIVAHYYIVNATSSIHMPKLAPTGIWNRTW